MRTLGSERPVVAMAEALRLNHNGDPVEAVVQYCLGKVTKWIEAKGTVKSIFDLEALVCRNLHLEFEEVWSDGDLKSVISKYVNCGEPVFLTLHEDLDEETFAVLIRLKRKTPRSHDQYVAAIDCRGAKGARRFFSRWHEISHLLTLYRQMELPLHRSQGAKDPTERLMDVIAGRVGFYPPLFAPVLEREASKNGKLTFAAVERVRSSFSISASFQSTLNACVAQLKWPAILIEAGIAFKKVEIQEIESGQRLLFEREKPQARLRVLNVVPNAFARKRMQIHKNMRVPPCSTIFRAFEQAQQAGSSVEIAGEENLGDWQHSDGTSLAPIKVVVEARSNDRTVTAIIVPSE